MELQGLVYFTPTIIAGHNIFTVTVLHYELHGILHYELHICLLLVHFTGMQWMTLFFRNND